MPLSGSRGEGNSFDEAVKYASEMIWQTHLDYQNANRSRFMPGNVAKTLLMFRQYSLGMTWFLARNFWQTFKGESKEVRRQAFKTLAGTLGMTAVFSGTLGLPVLGAIFTPSLLPARVQACVPCRLLGSLELPDQRCRC